MHNFFSNRLLSIKTSPILEVTRKTLSLIRQGKDVIHLGIGETDLLTPPQVRKAAIDFIERGEVRYTDVDGIVELKEAVAQKFKVDNNLHYEINQITVGTGAKQVLFNTLLATLNPGDEVIIPAPYWSSYPDMVIFAQGTPVIVECSKQDQFKLRPEALAQAITPKTKWLMLNSPNNPSGAVYDKAELQELAAVLMQHPSVHVISDDIYEGLVFEKKKFYTIAEVEPKLYDRTITINGVSKSYSMTGWRIGYGGGPQSLIKAISTIQSQSTSNPCTVSQIAALHALKEGAKFVQESAALFERRRDIFYNQLITIPGFYTVKPAGAFYYLTDCSELFGTKTPSGQVISNSADFASYLLEEAQVAVVPGTAFGTPECFRISFSLSEERIVEACDRIKKALSKLK